MIVKGLQILHELALCRKMKDFCRLFINTGGFRRLSFVGFCVQELFETAEIGKNAKNHIPFGSLKKTADTRYGIGNAPLRNV